jgi:hypothetical protein
MGAHMDGRMAFLHLFPARSGDQLALADRYCIDNCYAPTSSFALDSSNRHVQAGSSISFYLTGACASAHRRSKTCN